MNKKSKEMHIKTCTYYSLSFQWHDQYKKKWSKSNQDR